MMEFENNEGLEKVPQMPRKPSHIEEEYNKIIPSELVRSVRLKPRRFSKLSNNTLSSTTQRTASGTVIPTTNDYVEQGFFCTPKGYRQCTWILCFIQGISMLLWLASIILVKYYWPASHLTGKFLPGHIYSRGRTRMILFATFGSQPSLSFFIVLACLVLALINIRWIRICYITNTWISTWLLVVGFYILWYAGTVTEYGIREQLKEEMRNYDDNNTLTQILQYSSNPIDVMSHQDWDEIQIFFQCCGIDSEEDWYKHQREFYDETELEDDDSIYWKVPHSCCRDQTENLRLCIREPERNLNLIWHDHGCFLHYQELLFGLGSLAGIQILANMIIQGMTIYIMATYYSIERLNDGTGYIRSYQNFIYEIFLLHLFREKKFIVAICNRKRSKVSPAPIKPLVNINDSSSTTSSSTNSSSSSVKILNETNGDDEKKKGGLDLSSTTEKE